MSKIKRPDGYRHLGLGLWCHVLLGPDHSAMCHKDCEPVPLWYTEVPQERS